MPHINQTRIGDALGSEPRRSRQSSHPVPPVHLARSADLGTAPGGPRTVPVRSAWPGTKALTFCSPPQRADMLRTGTVRGPAAVSRCAPARSAGRLLLAFDPFGRV